MDKIRATFPYFLDTGERADITIDYHRLAQQRLEIGGFDENETVACGLILHRNELVPRQVDIKLDEDGSVLKTIVKDLETFLQLRNNPETTLGKVIRVYGEDFFKLGFTFQFQS